MYLLMPNTYPVAKAQANLPRILKEAEDHIIAITRRDEKVAYVVSKEQLESLVESLELMSNPEAVKAIRAARAGKTKYYPIESLEDEG